MLYHLIRRCGTLGVCITAVLGTTVSAQAAPEAITSADIGVWMVSWSNWGRWGNDDRLGTLNLITPEKRRAAASLVAIGRTVSLARRLSGDTSVADAATIGHEVRPGGIAASDTYTINYHGFSLTHIDGLPHFWSAENRMYNDVPAQGVANPTTNPLGVEVMHEGIVTRAVLVDIPRLRGIPYLEPGAMITVDEIETWERRTGSHIGTGDALLISTGRWKRVAELGPWPAGSGLAGLSPSAAGWLRARGVAVLGCDCVSDRLPSIVEDVPFPLHQLVIAAMGMPLLDNLLLTDLAETAAELDRWEFLLVVAPLRVVGGTGSPVNPIAVF